MLQKCHVATNRKGFSWPPRRGVPVEGCGTGAEDTRSTVMSGSLESPSLMSPIGEAGKESGLACLSVMGRDNREREGWVC